MVPMLLVVAVPSRGWLHNEWDERRVKYGHTFPVRCTFIRGGGKLVLTALYKT